MIFYQGNRKKTEFGLKEWALHTEKLYYIWICGKCCGSKLQSSLAKKLLSFRAWVKMKSLQDIAINDEGGKILQKRDLQY